MQKYNNLLQEVITEATNINIPISINIVPTITINTRAKGRFGQCKKHNGQYLIEISQYLTEAEEKYIREVLAHEILHTCPNCMNHGRQWKLHAMRMNYKYGYEISRTNSCANMGITSPKITEAKYVIICQDCGCKTHKQRECKVIRLIDKCHCGKCGSKNLKLQKNY